MFLNHLEIILHGVGLPDCIMDSKDSTWDKLFRVELIEVGHLTFFVGIEKDKIEWPSEFDHFLMGITPDTGYPPG